MSTREVVEGIQEQGTNESINYVIDTVNWGGTPSAPDFDIFNEEDLTTSLKSTLAPGTASVNVDDLLLPAIAGGTEEEIYRVYFSFTSGSNNLEGYFRIHFKR